MKLKNLLTKFFLLSAFFIIGGASYAAHSAKRSDRVLDTSALTRLWLKFVFVLSSWKEKLNKSIQSTVEYIISHILQIIALLISNMIAGTYYKRHGIHNDDEKDLWQRVKQKVRRP